MERLRVIYYGYVFDASGYGQAARAYIHALHSADVELSVVDLNCHARQVRDPLVESLAGRELQADFHLFHGIPPQWARRAFSMANAIGMTVWETDLMPTQWRNVLNHVLEVWLPCEFNVNVFRSALDKPVFKLPHALLPQNFNGEAPEPDAFLGTREGELVFYSLFEWQHRKGPHELIEAYLRAFPAENDVVLIIKANPQSASVAQQAVEEARRRFDSNARIMLRCEAWSDAQIDALHRRGDCYVSLHRGEGWGYPLFEAASRGKPVIATEYSGPLEYLNSREHLLVRCASSKVRQPYLYYNPRMRWVDPDTVHAAEQMRRVYERRETWQALAAQSAERILRQYSITAIGQTAKQRMMDLLRRSNPERYQRLERAERSKSLSPTAPISAEWYDQDYFEHGIKSNWGNGYAWNDFAELFHRTADFLAEMFPHAESFLDAGCAKGFLLRALRERGKECFGFDFSRWAIDNADEPSRAFIMPLSVDEAEFEREFDVLTAFSLLESLTEEQIHSFLSRARRWTRQAIFATVTSFDNEEEEARIKSDDGDLSHITLRSREWWRQAFIQAGWRQDALHRNFESLCQRHQLATTMGWKIYVYSARDI
jgi:glycosyltransferase involved in cell wall biosynthesis